MSIGENIHRRRIELGMTLEEVSKQVGVSRQTLSRYETGVIGNIPSDKIEALAKALRSTPAYIMGWDGEPIKKEKPPTPEEQERRDNAQEIARLIMLLPPEHQKMFVAQINAVLAQLKSHPEHQ